MKSNYTICYFSKASKDLSEESIHEIIAYSSEKNNIRGIRGILLHSLGNFFQVLEGDRKVLLDLYENKIKLDKRHHSIFEVINKSGSDPIFTKYSSKFEAVDDSEQLNEIKAYLAKHSIHSSTSDKISRLLKSFIIVDY